MTCSQAILRTIEVSTSDYFRVTGSVSGIKTYFPSQNVFPNILALMADISDQMVSDSILLYLNEDEVKSEIGSATQAITGGTISGVISVMLGFAGTESTPGGGNYVASTNKLVAAWIPDYYSSDTDWFQVSSSDEFSGSIGIDGNLSGVPYESRSKRVFEWEWIRVQNLIENVGQPAITQTDEESDRCFLKVCNDARKAQPTISTTGNAYLKGVYYIEDIFLYAGSGASLPTSWDDGSTIFDGTLLNNYVFCSISSPPAKPDTTDGNQRYYYNCKLELTTAVSDFDWDIS